MNKYDIKEKFFLGLLIFFFLIMAIIVLNQFFDSFFLLKQISELYKSNISSIFIPIPPTNIFVLLFFLYVSLFFIVFYFQIKKVKNFDLSLFEDFLSLKPIDTLNLKEKVLVNVVEEIFLVQKNKKPQIYILNHETINSFYFCSEENSILIVTSATLESLERTEISLLISQQLNSSNSKEMSFLIKIMVFYYASLYFTKIRYVLMENLFFQRKIFYSISKNDVLYKKNKRMRSALNGNIESILEQIDKKMERDKGLDKNMRDILSSFFEQMLDLVRLHKELSITDSMFLLTNIGKKIKNFILFLKKEKNESLVEVMNFLNQIEEDNKKSLQEILQNVRAGFSFLLIILFGFLFSTQNKPNLLILFFVIDFFPLTLIPMILLARNRTYKQDLWAVTVNKNIDGYIKLLKKIKNHNSSKEPILIPLVMKNFVPFFFSSVSFEWYIAPILILDFNIFSRFNHPNTEKRISVLSKITKK